MCTEWAADFSYSYFEKLLLAIRRNFDHYLISNAAETLQRELERPALFLRHDIDVEPFRALKLAEIEASCGVSATYMVMLNTPLYCVEDSSTISALFEIRAMGHEIGLHYHFDGTYRRNNGLDSLSLAPEIRKACKYLEALIGESIGSFSFHRPARALLNGPLLVAGRVNAYAEPLMAWYLSDSKGVWREGEPLPMLLRPRGCILQLLIHPIWWGPCQNSPEDRLTRFLKEFTREYSLDQLEAFETELSGYMSVGRLNLETRETFNGDKG